MADRESFEDTGIINDYRDAIPRVDTAYRARLRVQLGTMPAPQRKRLPRFRWQWTAPASIVTAAAVAVGLLLVPFGPRHETPLTPESVLARAISASSNPVPYSGSSVMSFAYYPPDVAPNATARDLSTYDIVSQWAVRDKTHWRVAVHVLRPALQSERQIAVANGRAAVWHRGLNRRAVRYPFIDPGTASELLSALQGPGRVPLLQTLKQYLQALNDPQTQTYARVVGQTTLLGRTADVIEIGPLTRESKTVAYGHARLWIDHQYGLVLRYEEYGLPANSAAIERGLLYRVTVVTFGSGPTAAELSYRPPAQPLTATGGFSGRIVSSLSGNPGPMGHWRAPAGFLTPGAPIGAKGQHYALVGTSQAEDSWFAGLPGGTTVGGVYRLHRSPGTVNNAASGPFVYVQEQYRITGLPAQFTRGAHHSAARCTVYTGSYPDGLHWMALARGKISLLAVANRLRERELVAWATTQMCR